jgi:aldehyde dehydrogenase (NAD+)
MGPIANAAQYRRVVGMIEQVAEGATLLAGGPGARRAEAGPVRAADRAGRRHARHDRAREEVFGPVLSIIAYDTVEQAVQIANDTPYGLSGYVWGADLDACRDVAARLRARAWSTSTALRSTAQPRSAGYKMSGNGREWGVYGLREFLEVKSVWRALNRYGKSGIWE